MNALHVYTTVGYTHRLSVGIHTRVAPVTHLAFVQKCAAARATGDHGTLVHGRYRRLVASGLEGGEQGVCVRAGGCVHPEQHRRVRDLHYPTKNDYGPNVRWSRQ